MAGPVPAVELDVGELVVGVLDTRTCGGMTFARWAGITVVYQHPGAAVVGSPQFVTGYLLGAAAVRTYTAHPP